MQIRRKVAYLGIVRALRELLQSFSLRIAYISDPIRRTRLPRAESEGGKCRLVLKIVPRRGIIAVRMRQTPQKEVIMKYICDVCGYVYDEELGDPDNGIDPGTTWAELPDDFVCPLCGVGKEDFSPEA